MSFKDELATRIRAALSARAGVDERVMFGGVAFMLDGNMCVGTLTPGFAGIASGGLMVRVGKGPAYDAALAEPDVEPMVMAGRTMAGYVCVRPAACATVPQVRTWAERAIAFVQTLPAKPVKPVQAKAPTTPAVAKPGKTASAKPVARRGATRSAPAATKAAVRATTKSAAPAATRSARDATKAAAPAATKAAVRAATKSAPAATKSAAPAATKAAVRATTRSAARAATTSAKPAAKPTSTSGRAPRRTR